MAMLLIKGSTGADVGRLAKALLRELGNDGDDFKSLSDSQTIDETFDAAIRRWQAGVGLIADGVVGPLCQVLLGLLEPQGGKFTETPLTVAAVSRLFPATKPANIARYLPYIEAALGVCDLTDKPMVLTALGTIRAESEGFVPITEFPSKFNSDPGAAPFNRYDGRLGNETPGDGFRYRGRGFVQLTGKFNYQKYGKKLDFPLVAQPDLANAPEIAALLLATFLADVCDTCRAAATNEKDLPAARKLVNGGSHGLDRFRSVFTLAKTAWNRNADAVGAGGAAVHMTVAGASRRASLTSAKTKKDVDDLRDRVYQPGAISLPNEFPSPKDIAAYLGPYSKVGLILDQGREGACTGFGLSCVVNYLRWIKAGHPKDTFVSVSPRMLYTLARRYDEYEGENYEGSSCRGAIKAWFTHGVCLETDWPYAPEKSNPPSYGYAQRAAENTLGVYYRVETRSITDMQAALREHGAVFVSAFTHDGWVDAPEISGTPKSHKDLPLIAFDGRPSQSGGHAFALVGYDARGFIVQNSWGTSWGAGGFAILGYRDWLVNAMDAWIVALGVPGVIEGRLVAGGQNANGVAGAQVDKSKWWDASVAYQHSVVLGNDGRVARYVSEDEKPRKLQQQVYALPDQWFRSAAAPKTKRLVIYAHGGLNSEKDAIDRACAMGRFFIANGCYPLFLVWKTGLLESLRGMLTDAVQKQPSQADLAGSVSDFSDALIEKTFARKLARPIWSEMKENADLAFAPRRGGELLVDALTSLSETWGDDFELHVVGHSAGSIILGHMLSALCKRGQLADHVRSVHLYAPACTVAFANQHYASDSRFMNRLFMDVLSDEVERNDTVASIYRKSLLYMVSNALEADLRTPILGLANIWDPNYALWDGSSDTAEALSAWRKAFDEATDEKLDLVTSSKIRVGTDPGNVPVQQKAAHGGFDNDIDVVTRTLERITGAALASPVDELRGF